MKTIEEQIEELQQKVAALEKAIKVKNAEIKEIHSVLEKHGITPQN